MKNIEGGNWLNEFNFENLEKRIFKDFSDEIVDDSYDTLNKFCQKENKKNKGILKKRKQAWQ